MGGGLFGKVGIVYERLRFLDFARNDMGGVQDDLRGAVGDDGCEGEFGRVEATPGVIPRLLRLTVSLWSLPCARLEPGGVFQEVRFSSVFPGPCDKRTVWRQLPRQYGRP